MTVSHFRGVNTSIFLLAISLLHVACIESTFIGMLPLVNYFLYDFAERTEWQMTGLHFCFDRYNDPTTKLLTAHNWH